MKNHSGSVAETTGVSIHQSPSPAFMARGCRNGLTSGGSVRKGEATLRLPDLLSGRQGMRVALFQPYR
jgi:hypothetical protein